MNKMLTSNKERRTIMKKLNENIENEIDLILQSGVKKDRVKTSPFFTTRVMGKVEQLETESVWLPRLSAILRPALVLLVIVNVINYYVYDASMAMDTSNESGVELAANDYAAWNSDFILTDDVLLDN
ncbi:hypothetical protein [Saccharicrinis fermentans]|uniref:Uncharacterized protein n=1 Tax=Saccharicrinis fermentans DSM 9555 = JCM 21142 TaxID=869213 RepID=W7Y400_9BACT|nr:hypothetical protein [Saccharicrinis fermentans]GAF02308.1 hypothetical protein JCM21142_3942 [Saccharicrinis fermentans DSM 9555 = JCM 21142]